MGVKFAEVASGCAGGGLVIALCVEGLDGVVAVEHFLVTQDSSDDEGVVAWEAARRKESYIVSVGTVVCMVWVSYDFPDVDPAEVFNNSGTDWEWVREGLGRDVGYDLVGFASVDDESVSDFCFDVFSGAVRSDSQGGGVDSYDPGFSFSAAVKGDEVQIGEWVDGHAVIVEEVCDGVGIGAREDSNIGGAKAVAAYEDSGVT